MIELFYLKFSCTLDVLLTTDALTAEYQITVLKVYLSSHISTFIIDQNWLKSGQPTILFLYVLKVL